jgi:feruloyl esterase
VTPQSRLLTLNSINYYTSVVDFAGRQSKISDFYRLFMIPGMDHCSGGEGPNTFDSIQAIEEWVEAGTAPDAIVASELKDGKVMRTHPLCLFPQVAKYKGRGGTDDASSFKLRSAEGKLALRREVPIR